MTHKKDKNIRDENLITEIDKILTKYPKIGMKKMLNEIMKEWTKERKTDRIGKNQRRRKNKIERRTKFWKKLQKNQYFLNYTYIYKYIYTKII